MKTPLLKGELNGVKWKSLNPPQEKIRSEEIERLCRKYNKTAPFICRMFFNKTISEHINTPVQPLRYHRRLTNYARHKYSS